MRHGLIVHQRALRQGGGGPNMPPAFSVDIDDLVAINVTVGNTVQITARVNDAGNNILTGRTITWSSATPSIGTIGLSSGVFNAVGAGTVVITATCEGKTNTTSVTVTTPVNPVATVTLSPTSLALNVGSTSQFTATATDAQGNVCLNRVVTWTSGTPGTGTVSASSGTGPYTTTFTALGAGTSNVTATCEGKISTAAVATVTAVSSGTFTHEPPGFVLISDNPFNTTPGPALWTRVTTGTDTIITDATAPYSPSNVIQAAFTTTNPQAGSAPVNVAVNSSNMSLATGGKYLSELYVCFWIKLSSAWACGHTGVSNPGIVKIIFMGTDLRGDGGSISDTDTYLCVIGTLNGPIGFQVRFQGLKLAPPSQSNNVSATTNTSAAALTRDVWKKVEMHMVANTPGVRDGQVRLWMDDLLTHTVTDVGWGTSLSTCLITLMRFNPTLGGQGWFSPTQTNFAEADMYMWIDHFHLSGKFAP